VDGHHVSRQDIDLIAEVAGNRMIFVTDAMAAAGQPDGGYNIGNLEVVVASGIARLKSNGALAGSTLTMQGAITHAHHCGINEALIESAACELPSALLRAWG
jgi:N-acetylglucosamine-6-phosphate deacetylase